MLTCIAPWNWYHKKCKKYIEHHWTLKHLGAWKCLIFQGYATRQAQGIRPLLSWKKAHMSTCHWMASKCGERMSTVNGVFTCDQVTKWSLRQDEGYRFPAKATLKCEWNVNPMKQLRIPKLHRNSLSRKVFGDTQWRTYQEFGELCKACRAETGSNFPCEVCPVGNLFFKHVDFRTLELVCERLAWSPFPKLHCCWTEDVRRYNAGLFSILEFNFVWFSGNLRLSRILDDSSKRLCWELHIYAARKGLSPKGISIASRESSRSWCTRPV